MLRDADTAFGRVDPGSSLLGSSVPGSSLPGGTGTRPGAGQIDAQQIDAPWGGDVVVHDAHLLFQGEYSRVGFDLVIRDDAHRLTVHDYFRPGRRPNLVSEEGASLSGEVVEALALAPHGPRYAQAGTAPAAPTVGRVETVGGTASVIRNGSAVALNVGDLVYRGDVVQTGGGSSLGITFIDGTAFSLLSGARMVLNDMVYTPGGTGNSALISLVQGSISFVAGQVAKTGDMRVDTPVATMGIRGTAVNVDISADNGTTRFSVMREPDGRVGSYVLYSKTNPNVVLATVSQADVGVVVEANGSVTSFTKSPGDLGAEQILVQFVFQLFNAGQANPIPVTPAPAPAPPPGGPQGGGGAGSSTPPDGSVGNGSSGPASPRLPAPVDPPRPDNGAGGPPIPGALPSAPGGGGGGGSQQTSTALTDDTSTDGDSATPVGGAPAIVDTPATGGAPQIPGTGPSEPAPPGQTASQVPLQPRTVTIAADSLALGSGSRDGVLAREGASDASIATERVVAAHATAGPDVAVGSDPATVTGTYGTLAIRQDGSYSYLALRATALAQGETGDDVFTFTVQEADGSRTTSTITFHVEGKNDAPTAAPDRGADLSAGSAVDAAVKGAGVLANDTDPDRGETAALVVGAVHAQDAPDVAVTQGAPTTVAGRYGALTIAADGTYRYVADHAQALGAGRVGDDLFTYTITDPNGATSSASLAFGVTGVNDAPAAQDQSATLEEDGSTTITPVATDPDATDTLTYSVVTGPQHGSVVFESGSFRYTPTGDYDGPDGFTYRANDGTADSNVATVTLTVTGVNDAPAVDLDTGTDGTGASVEYSGPVLIAPGPVSITDPDPGATIDHVTLTLTSSGGPDTIDTLSLDGSTGYVLDPGGSDGVYVLHRQDGQPGAASDYADVLSRIVFTSGDDTTDRTVEIAVVANDGLTDGDAAVSAVHVPASPGGGNQAPQVTPSGVARSYAFGGSPVVVDPSITVTDADSPTLDYATIRVSLEDFSVVVGDVLRITGGAGFTFDSGSMSDLRFADGGVIHQSFADGTLTLTGENASPADFQAAFEAVAFSTTDETQSGDRRVSFTANDGVSESYAVYDRIAVRFTPNDIFTTPLDTPITAAVRAGAGAGTTYAFGAPAHGTVVAADPNDPRAFTYTPAAGYSGPDSFAYTVDDGAGGTTIGHITIGVDPNQGGQFGFALASLGDLDGDGLADMSASAPGNYDGGGLVFISRNNGGDHQYQVQGSPGEQLGYALAGLGDLSRDGTPDLVAGAPGANGGAGAAYVVFGRADTANTATVTTASLDGTSGEGFAITGAGPRDRAGSSVAAAGYVNGDAIPDILVGAPDAAEGAGTAYLVYGKTDTGTVSLAAIEGGDTTNGIVVYGAAGDHLGFSVAGGGDLDADGFADIVVGAPGDGTTPGSVYVIRGAAALGNIDVTVTGTFTGLRIAGAAAGDQFGYAVASIGDVNGDGYDDIAIGAPNAAAGDRVEAGKVYVVYGAPDLSGIDVANLGTRGFTISGGAGGDHLGTSVAFAGDVNGDGFADIIVGAPDSTIAGRPGNGSAYVVLGSAAGQNVDVGLVQFVNLAGSKPEDHLGSSVSTTGDSGGSGLAGFASGAPRSYDVDSNSVNTGYYGSTSYSPPAFTVSGDASDNALSGTDGADIIGGQQGDDLISGLGGADVLNGGQGQDVFMFAPSDAVGRAVIADFHAYATTPAEGERDQLDTTGFGVPIAILIANAMQVNSHDTLVMLDESHSVLLKNVLKASLTGDDFTIPAL